jgi:hypothetical protein
MEKDRLINTGKERGIDEAKINAINPEDDEVIGVVDETPPMVEEKNIETPKELIDSVKESKIEEMSEKQIEDKYLEIIGKIDRKEKLTLNETNFKNKVDESIARAEAQMHIQNETKRLAEKEQELEKKEEFLKEYIKTKEENPDKIIQTKQKELTLTGGDSLPKLLHFVFMLRKAKKKGGKILVQVMRNKQVYLKWTKADLAYVEFITKDEHGNELLEVTRFNEYIYTYEGTPIPVLFAIQGIAEGYNFFGEFKKDITAEMVGRLTSRAYHAGYQKGAELVDPNKNKKNLLDTLMKFMPVILIVGLLALGYLMWQMVGQMNEMYKVVTNPEAVQALQNAAYIAARDANALIVR